VSKPAHDPLWYKDAVVYQLHVRAFSDHNADGIGDFQGLTRKLDYLQDLGVTAIWLLPFYPSPLRDDGYDIADYTDVNPDYGTREDFKNFLRAAHARGLRVITELVVNHTSDQHPWFQKARRAKPGSPARDFYVWSDTPDRYKEARIIFKDFEASNWTWDPVAESYYWHRFYSHQPDLNFENPAVTKALHKVLEFWMDMGVDGMRLDAVPYLFERDGTGCENLPETHVWLKDLRAHLDRKYEGRMLLAEANQWPEDACAYFGSGDECHMAFHFPLMPRLFMAVRMEDRFPILDILRQTPAIPDPCQWAVFLRNHDELTLEMVTDEERDYMYRVYARDRRARINLGIRRRLAPLLGNDRRRIELMNGLLFALVGTPVLYYGDEIGMGDNIYLGDRNGVRTPMQWSPDRNAGFSRATPQRLYLPVVIDPEYHYETVNVETQGNNLHSLLWWTKRLIALRRRYQAFSRGALEFLTPENNKVLAFLRTHGEERILVVANLSRFVQCAEIDLSRFEGMVPLELFGRSRFPRVGKLPYFLTLGPHSFHAFSLIPEEAERVAADELPTFHATGGWSEALRSRGPGSFLAELPRMLQRQRWFGGKARVIQSTTVVESIPFPLPGTKKAFELVLVRVDYTEGEPENYALPLGFASGEDAGHVRSELPRALVARVEREGASEGGILYDALFDPDFGRGLLDALARRRRFKAKEGEVQGHVTAAFKRLNGAADLAPSILGAEQSNTSVVFGRRAIFKLFRKVDQGVNPDLEISQHLTERAAFPHVPPVLGSLVYRRTGAEDLTLGVLQAYVPNQGDAWRYTLDDLGRYFDRVRARQDVAPPATLPPTAALLLRLVQAEPADPEGAVSETIGPYLDTAQLLGRRTGELHRALSAVRDDPAFAPEPYTTLYQRSIYQSMRNQLGRAFQLLERRIPDLPEAVRPQAIDVLAHAGEAEGRFRAILGDRLEALRIRIHGDFHLGQVLFTGDDFVIIDFEGEPARPLSERKLKRSPLRDVAGMLRSFHYATHTALDALRERGEQEGALEAWRNFWQVRVSAAFLRSYLDVVGDSGILPRDPSRLAVLLDAYVLDKAVYELTYELNNRPSWVGIPLQGVLQLIRRGD